MAGYTAVEAAHVAIDLLERGQAVGTEVLTVLVEAVGEDASLLIRRKSCGFQPQTRRQRITAIVELQAFIAGRRS